MNFTRGRASSRWSALTITPAIFIGATPPCSISPSRKVPRHLVREDLTERAHAFDARFNAARLFPMHGPRYFLGQWLKKAHHLLARRGFHLPVWDRLVAL